VQVVEHENNRLRVSCALQETSDRVEQTEAGRLRIVDYRRVRQIRYLLAHLDDDIRDLRCVCTQLSAESVGIDLTCVGADGLHPRPVRRCPTGLPTAAPHDFRSAFGCRARQLFGKTALTDAWLAADD
jgi:hypothetical protein